MPPTANNKGPILPNPLTSSCSVLVIYTILTFQDYLKVIFLGRSAYTEGGGFLEDWTPIVISTGVLLLNPARQGVFT